IADAKDLARYRNVGVTCVKPNYDEAVGLLGVPRMDRGDRAGAIVRRASRLFERTGAQYVAVTLDQEGAVILERGGEWYRTYAGPASNAWAAAPGDTLSVLMGTARGAVAVRPPAGGLAARASQGVVRRDGTTSCSRQERVAAILGVDRVVAGAGQVGTLTI